LSITRESPKKEETTNRQQTELHLGFKMVWGICIGHVV